MSILKSTKSGLNRDLTPSSIITIGFSQKDGDGILGVYYFYCTQDHNLKLKYNIMDGIFRFDFKPIMHSIEKVEYTDTCVVKTLEDLKLLKDWWFCEDIHKSPRIEKLVLDRLREPGMNNTVAELSDTINKKIIERIFETSMIPKSGFKIM